MAGENNESSGKPEESRELSLEEQSYRNALLTADDKAVAEYDKAVMTLSGGALGISFSFLQYIGTNKVFVCPNYLIAAWICWAFSIAIVVASFYFSHRAMRRALWDLNKNQLHPTKPGRHWDTLINFFNPIGGLLFLAGVISIVFFVSHNISYGTSKSDGTTVTFSTNASYTVQSSSNGTSTVSSIIVGTQTNSGASIK